MLAVGVVVAVDIGGCVVDVVAVVDDNGRR